MNTIAFTPVYLPFYIPEEEINTRLNGVAQQDSPELTLKGP
jgi:hypothetical protein